MLFFACSTPCGFGNLEGFVLFDNFHIKVIKLCYIFIFYIYKNPIKYDKYVIDMVLSLLFMNYVAESGKVPGGQKKWKLKSEITADSELMDMLHKDLSGKDRISAHEFFLTLAACNTVIPIVSYDPSSSVEWNDLHKGSVAIEYQGESPDEIALVTAASAYGYTLFERTSGHIAIDVNGEKLR